MVYSIQLEGETNISYFALKSEFTDKCESLVKKEINFTIKLIMNNEYVCSKCNTDVIINDGKKTFLCKCKNAKIFANMTSTAHGISTCGIN